MRSTNSAAAGWAGKKGKGGQGGIRGFLRILNCLSAYLTAMINTYKSKRMSRCALLPHFSFQNFHLLTKSGVRCHPFVPGFKLQGKRSAHQQTKTKSWLSPSEHNRSTPAYSLIWIPLFTGKLVVVVLKPAANQLPLNPPPLTTLVSMTQKLSGKAAQSCKSHVPRKHKKFLYS